MRNIRRLELFYYVAFYRGITRAARLMPHRISQPSLSRQMRLLEDQYRCQLFVRDPFALTSQGAKLYAHLRLTLENLDQVLDELNGPSPRLVRIASTPLILRDYFTEILTSLRRRYPSVLFTMAEGSQRELERWFEGQEVDLVIQVLEGKLPPGCHKLPLLKVPLVLLAPQNSPVRSLSDLLDMDPRKVHLLGTHPHDPITRAFRQGLTRWPLGWLTIIQANSLELIEASAKAGHGIGISLLVPGRPLPPGVRAVSLPGFPELKLGAVWRGPRDDVIDAILVEVKKRAKAMA